MDERYRNVSPLRINTIETLYPELKKSDQNKSNNEQNAVYFNIDGNNIELVARILFYDDYTQNFIENDVELNKTYEDVILEGLQLWSGEFAGAYSEEENIHYDFIQGMKMNVTEIIVGRELKKNEEKYNKLIQYMKQNYKHSGTLSYDIYIREEITIFKIWQNKVKTEETFPLYQDEGLYMLLTDLYGTNIKYMEFYFDENGYMAARISVKTIENGKDEEGTDKYILYSLLYWEPEYSGDSPSAGTREYCIENTHLKASQLVPGITVRNQTS